MLNHNRSQEQQFKSEIMDFKSQDSNWQYRYVLTDDYGKLDKLFLRMGLVHTQYDAADDVKAEALAELMEIMLECIETELTELQYKCYKFYFIDGLTQCEIAKMLKRNQTIIHKTLFGNIDYYRGGVRHGGIIKKLRRVMLKNERVLQLMQIIGIRKEDLPDGQMSPKDL
jgi:hypothetical protein